jgi:hypothetical protein
MNHGTEHLLQRAVGPGRPYLTQPAQDGNLLHPPASRKRERDEFNADANLHDYSADVAQEEDQTQPVRTSKRSRHAPVRTTPAGVHPCSLVIHRVQCDGGENHSRHKQLCHFTDVPRLFAGDSKASAVRGRKPISTLVEEYLEDHPEISLVVYKTYSCNEYHEFVKDQFQRLQVPKMDFEVISQLRSYFFSLRMDGPPASFISEEMNVISEELKEAMGLIEASAPAHMANWRDARNMKAPYLHLYHCRALIRKQARTVFHQQPMQLEHVNVLLDYVNTAYGPEYAVADAEFAQGFVSRVHFPKLFGPNEVVVTTKNDQLLAYVSESCPETDRLPLELSCWSWNFDGLFRKENTSLFVDWPSPSASVIRISDLATYPLRLDTTGRERILRDRGEVFWKCRQRYFVSYQSPNSSMQTVRVPIPSFRFVGLY